jgi:hypothetical protein
MNANEAGKVGCWIGSSCEVELLKPPLPDGLRVAELQKGIHAYSRLFAFIRGQKFKCWIGRAGAGAPARSWSSAPQSSVASPEANQGIRSMPREQSGELLRVAELQRSIHAYLRLFAFIRGQKFEVLNWERGRLAGRGMV